MGSQNNKGDGSFAKNTAIGGSVENKPKAEGFHKKADETIPDSPIKKMGMGIRTTRRDKLEEAIAKGSGK